MPPLLILLISLWGVRLPAAWLMSERIGAEGIWWSFPLAAALSSFLAVLYYRFGGWRRAHMMATSPA
jgi:Na+-driven multidrug efflux pump